MRETPLDAVDVPLSDGGSKAKAKPKTKVLKVNKAEIKKSGKSQDQIRRE